MISFAAAPAERTYCSGQSRPPVKTQTGPVSCPGTVCSKEWWIDPALTDAVTVTSSIETPSDPTATQKPAKPQNTGASTAGEVSIWGFGSPSTSTQTTVGFDHGVEAHAALAGAAGIESAAASVRTDTTDLVPLRTIRFSLRLDLVRAGFVEERRSPPERPGRGR